MLGRVVILSDGSVPALSGSGNAVLLNGLGEALKTIGCAVSYVVAQPKKRWQQPGATQEDVRYIEPDPAFGVADWLPHEDRYFRSFAGYVPGMQRVLDSLAPEVVFCYTWSMWSVFRRVETAARRVLVTVDMEYEVRQLRGRFEQGATGLTPRTLVRRVLRPYRAGKLKALEYRFAREAGLVLCSAAHHAEELKQQGAAVYYVPAPVAGSSVKRARPSGPGPVKIGLLGNLIGTHTRDGLRYFFDEIWPAYLRSDLVGRFRFVVMGGGHLPPTISWPAPHPDLVATGYVADLDGALQDIAALLVPIPSTLGFRMRILEAFRRAIPVIAHEAACAGMPQLTGANSFLCAAPGDFLDTLRQIAEQPEQAEQRAVAGAACFDQVFAAGRVAGTLAHIFERHRLLAHPQDEP